MTPAETGLTTSTAKTTDPSEPAVTVMNDCVQMLPAAVPPHDHPAVLSEALKVVSAGTVSMMITPSAGALPVLL